MIPHGVLKHWHPMVGCDWHIPWPPGSPAPAPAAAPYFTAQFMCGWNITAQIADDHLSDHWGLTMLKVTDIGPMIAHIGTPSVLLAIEYPLSSSKSYFGSSRYVSRGKPIAAALFWHLNPNLNCGFPVPTPTGGVIALTTHEVDMSWGDILSGALNMAIDFVIMWALNKCMGKVNSKAFNYIQQKIFKRFLGPLEQAAVREAVEHGWDKGIAASYAGVQAAKQFESHMTEAVVAKINWAITGGLTAGGLLFGSPLGVDASTPGTYGSYSEDHPAIGASEGDHRGAPGDWAGGAAGTGSNAAGTAVDNYLGDGNPSGYPKDIGPYGVTD
jgi:hypothetical protein